MPHAYCSPKTVGGVGGLFWDAHFARAVLQFAIFGNFCKRALKLVLYYSTGRNSAIEAKNKIQKFADIEENGPDEVFQ